MQIGQLLGDLRHSAMVKTQRGFSAKESNRVRYLFYPLAVAEFRVDHGLKGFYWVYVRNPLRVRRYGEGLWDAT